MNTAHSHHGDGHAGGRNQGNRQVSQAAGDHILIELFADAGEEQDGHGVTQGRADGVGNRLQEVIVDSTLMRAIPRMAQFVVIRGR